MPHKNSGLHIAKHRAQAYCIPCYLAFGNCCSNPLLYKFVCFGLYTAFNVLHKNIGQFKNNLFLLLCVYQKLVHNHFFLLLNCEFSFSISNISIYFAIYENYFYFRL